MTAFSLRKQLTVMLLLVAVLLAPLNSFAHDATSGASKDTCACQLLLPDCGTDESGDQPDHYPGNNTGDCCDSEECCPDAAEPPIFCDLRVNISGRQLFHPNINCHIPEVYLAIFVPPENRSLSKPLQ
ncbi:MAG: hypothetical protein FD174_4138 [Geobacteraceae bacterium]|nr:MAG: hypothetical protein FD174_4138 [Geobacteraceae bacterium]